ncbi:hypothetical protein TNCT_457771 [Trichonephila clavata]|uniref:Uncharacterized protein n=1 Tax=Trichonephila clavata TaxID=2740835 RepID=A0A8X6KNY8_TRICU|nr:hypothetical protein TNCT_457771 [Trichonephila clavata]
MNRGQTRQPNLRQSMAYFSILFTKSFNRNFICNSRIVSYNSVEKKALAFSNSTWYRDCIEFSAAGTNPSHSNLQPLHAKCQKQIYEDRIDKRTCHTDLPATNTRSDSEGRSLIHLGFGIRDQQQRFTDTLQVDTRWSLVLTPTLSIATGYKGDMETFQGFQKGC